MKVLVIGGSRNIGYHTALRLLASGATVVFLLRNTSYFDADENIKPHVASGKARLVKGDALKEEDVRNVWNIASEDGPIDFVLSTVGGTGKLSLTKGVVLTTPDLCCRSMLNLLAVFPREDATQPKLVVVSSTGLGKTAHSHLPLALKPVYGYLLDGSLGPHADKLGMERAISHSAGWTWPVADGEPDKAILPDGWQERLGPPGWLKHVVVVRPALLTDGDCKGDSPKKEGKLPYRAEDHEICGSYTVSRKDIAHFIVTQVLGDWQKWDGKCVRVAY